MKGTGIQTDPYLIETWDDFFDMTNDSVDTYYMLMNDLDGNDYNGGIFGHSNKVHSNLDGNGHSIRNLYYTYTGNYPKDYGLMDFNATGGTWKNLTIENVLTNISLFGNSTSNAVYMERCSISAECYTLVRMTQMQFRECTISAKVQASLTQRVSTTTRFASSFTRCTINVRVMDAGSEIELMNLNDSRLEMKVEGNSPSSSNGYSTMKAKNSVIVIDLPEGFAYSMKISGDTAYPSVLDSTLWGDAPIGSIGTGIIMLPTESMKNADALNAAGFTVARVS